MQDIQLVKAETEKYLRQSIVPKTYTFSDISQMDRLAFLQYTPAGICKKRPIGGGKQSIYIPIEYVKRALNFAFGFDYSTEIIKEEWKEITNEDKTNYHAYCRVRFTVTLDSVLITKEVYGAWIMPKTPTSSIFTVLEAARSNAIKNFAKEFGICADAIKKEETQIEKYRKDEHETSWKDCIAPNPNKIGAPTI